MCTTLAAYVMDNPDTWGAWLYNADALRADAPDGVEFFASLETDARGMAPFEPLTDRLTELGGQWWSYGFDDGRTSITTLNRLRHLTMGQNYASSFACDSGATHMLFLAADTMAPDNVFTAMQELSDAIAARGEPEPLVGPELTTYCLHGDPQPDLPWPVERQLISAACVLIPRRVFKQVRWRNDLETLESDDHCLRRDARELLGAESYVRKDVRATHFPVDVCAIEDRFPGRDMTVYR